MNNTSLNHNILDSKPPGRKTRILFTVTTDISYDQRMIRICTSLARAGYTVTLIGRKMKSSIPLGQQSFTQKKNQLLF